MSFDGNTYSYDFEVLAGGPKYTVQYLYGTSFSEGADEERISVDGIRDAGNYIVVLSIEESDNYTGYEKQYNFVLYKRYLSGANAQWSVQDYTYDGISRTVVIENLTEDAQVEYTGNVLLNATIYNVKAVIRETQNYMASELSTTISVNPLTMQLPQVTIPSAVYDGTEKSCSWDIDGLTTQGTFSAVNAGQYSFKLFAKDNYKFAEEDGYLLQGGFRKSFVEYSWEIAKADYDFGNAHWTYESPFVSDGTHHRVFIEGLNESLMITYGGTTYAYASGDYVATATISGFDSDNYNTPELLESLQELQWSIANAREGDYEYYAQDGNNAVLVDYFGNTPEVVLPTTVNGLKVFKIEPGLFEGHSEILSLDARSFALNKGALASLTNLRSLTTLRLNYKLSELFSVTGGSAPESLKALHLAQLYTYENFGPMLDAPALRELYFSGGTAQVGNYVQLGGHSSPLRLIEVRNANPSRFTVYCGSVAAANFYSIVRVYEGNVEYKRGDHTLTGNVDYTIEIGKTTWAGNFYYSLDEDAKTATVLSFNGESDVLRLQSSVYINGATYAIEGYVEGALEKHTGVERIVIDAGVAELPSGAFRGYNAVRTLEAGTLPTGSWQLEKLFGKIPDALNYVHFLSGCEVDSGCLKGSRVTKIEVDDGVVVNSGAFSDAEYLEQTILPSSLTVLPSSLFSNDISLTTVSYSHDLAEIGNNAFFGCISLTEMPSSASLTHVGDRAFYGCESLTEVALSASVETIGNYAFSNSGLKVITLSSSLKAIRYNAFDNTDIAEITIPASVEEIDNLVFQGCDSLTTVRWNSSKALDYRFASILSDAQNLTNLEFGGDVKEIPSAILRKSESLESITFGSSVVSIGDLAFAENMHLTRVTLSSNLTEISENAFDTCYNLVEVVNLSDLSFTPGENPFLYAKRIYTDVAQSSCIALDGQGFLFYEDGSERILLGYKGVAAEITLPSVAEKPYTVNPYAFAYNATITAVTVPEGITELKEGVFYGCENLQSLTLPASLTAIGVNAHTGCPNLESVRFNGTIEQWFAISRDCSKSTNDNPYDLYCGGTQVTHIELRFDMNVQNTLRDVRSLASVTLAQGLQSIPDYMFTSCINVENVQLPSGLVAIGRDAFSGCGITGKLVLPGSLTTLKYGAFKDCVLLQSVEFLSAVNTNEGAFVGCIGLQRVNLAEGMSDIGSYMFDGCSSLTSIELPNSIINIGYGAFRGCRSLTSIELPNSIINIDDRAFLGCRSLTSIEIPEGVESIGSETFSGCSNLANIIIGSNVTIISYDAFLNCSQLANVFYKGTAESWEKISIYTKGNDALKSATLYYYIEHAEDVPADGGNYWHYAEDGKTSIVW